MFRGKEHPFWKKYISNKQLYIIQFTMTDHNFYILWENVPTTWNCA